MKCKRLEYIVKIYMVGYNFHSELIEFTVHLHLNQKSPFEIYKIRIWKH